MTESWPTAWLGREWRICWATRPARQASLQCAAGRLSCVGFLVDSRSSMRPWRTLVMSMRLGLYDSPRGPPAISFLGPVFTRSAMCLVAWRRLNIPYWYGIFKMQCVARRSAQLTRVPPARMPSMVLLREKQKCVQKKIQGQQCRGSVKPQHYGTT